MRSTKATEKQEVAQTPDASKKMIFGVSLKEAARRSDQENWAIPSPIKKAIVYIESQEKFMKQEGIYRVPGSLQRVNTYIEKFNSGEDVALGLFAPWEVDEATSLIMNFLKHMTDGLFGDQKTNLKEAAASGDVSTMSHLLAALPLENRETLRLMVKHLAKVETYQEFNKMTAKTLSLCFGPSFAMIFPLMIQHANTIIPETIVFGVSLAEAAKRSDPQGLIPSPIKISIEFVEKCGMSEKLIYQESGSVNKIKQYRYRFNSGENVQYETADVHCATGIIYTFFRDMNYSLFTSELKPQFLQIKDLGYDETKVGTARKLVNQLPATNYAVLKFFCLHLSRVAAAKTNDMTVESISWCLGPSWSIIFPPLITYASQIFQ